MYLNINKYIHIYVMNHIDHLFVIVYMNNYIHVYNILYVVNYYVNQLLYISK